MASMNKNKIEKYFKDLQLKSVQHPKKEIYDIIDSEELEKLYQKNNQLLSQLSSTGRKNTILQTELYSLIEERSKLGVQNSFLTTKVAALKKAMSQFKKQEKKLL